MSRLGAKVRRGSCAVRVVERERPRPNRLVSQADQIARAWSGYRAPLFSPGLLAAALVAAWLVVLAIVVAGIAAVAGDPPAQPRRPVGFDTAEEA